MRIVDMVPDRIGRVAHDDADVEVLLAAAAFRVVGHDEGQFVLALGHSKSVGQQDAVERRVTTQSPS